MGYKDAISSVCVASCRYIVIADCSHIPSIQSHPQNSLCKNQQMNGLKLDEKREYEAEETEPIAGDLSKVYDYFGPSNLVCVMARELLSIPATSTSSERAFSAGKDVGIARMSFNPETVEALVCLRSRYRAGLVKELNFDENSGNELPNNND